VGVTGNRCAKITVDLDGHARIVMDFEQGPENLVKSEATAEKNSSPPAEVQQVSDSPRRPAKAKASHRRRAMSKRQRRKAAKRAKATRSKPRKQSRAKRNPISRTKPKPPETQTQPTWSIEPGQDSVDRSAPRHQPSTGTPVQAKMNLESPPAAPSNQPSSTATKITPGQTLQESSLYLPFIKPTGEVGWRAEKSPSSETETLTVPESGGDVEKPDRLVLSGRKTVLVVDDDSIMRMLLKMGLRSAAYDALLAENGKVAQQLVQAKSPDVILLDLLMPVMDGLSFLKWLRHTVHNQTPVLVFSNVNDPKITQQALHDGANGIACKPLHLKELISSIQKLVPG
jgi:CheY-like chemotaxis protein